MYRSLMLRQRESALAESMEQRQKGEQFRVIEPAFVSESPAAPKRPRLLGLALILALGAAAAAVVAAEALDGSLQTLEQAQTLSNLPVVGTIPRIQGPLDRRRARWRAILEVFVASCAVGALVAVSFYVARENWVLTALLLR
jgi:uncharacterized protein involved in exopolysaccharide biosynthesis